MRPFDSPRDRAQLIVAALAAGLVLAVTPLLTGLLGAAVLYVGFAPAQRWLTRWMPPRSAAVLVVIAAVILVCLPGLWLLGAAFAQAPAALERLRESAFLSRIGGLRIADVDLGSQVAEISRVAIAWVSGRALDSIADVVQGTLNLVIALFGLFFLLLSADRVSEAVEAYLPFSPANVASLRRRFVLVTEATLLGTALTAVLQGAIVGAGIWAVGLPSPVFWGAVTAVASVLPVMGSSLVWLPATIVLVAQQRYGAAAALGFVGVVASNIDNVMRPLVNRRVSNLHPMVTLVGAFAGVHVFGLAGLLLGPLAISYFFELLRIYHDEYGARGGLPERGDRLPIAS